MRYIFSAIAIFSVINFSTVSAQPGGAHPTNKHLRIGYTNVELILAYMPEAKQMNVALRTHEEKLMQQIAVKKNYYESKVAEYKELKEKGQLPKDKDELMATDIKKLEGEIQKFAEDSEAGYLKKKEELLQPIVDRLQKAIDAVAAEESFSYILNTNANGTSIILKGPEEDNITVKVLKKLNIEVPKELLEAEKKAPGGK